METKRKLKAKIVWLSYRVAELEERLCPCEEHDWKKVGSHYEFPSPMDIETVYHYKCRKCGKRKEGGCLMAKRLIDADEAKNALTGWETDPTDEEIEGTIDGLPTVAAVEVVRCRDCRMEAVCKITQRIGENGFCSYGERKEK